MKLVALTLGLAAILHSAEPHGRMIKPAHRGWMGRLPQFSFVPIDYSDNGLNAGGIAATTSGPHGVCGDPYAQAAPREHETGGIYGQFPTYGARAITGCYAPGAVVDIQIQVTANHMGYFTFGLCKLNEKNDKETEECFQTLTQPGGEKRWPVPPGNDVFKMQYQLPSGVTCDGDSHCILRWVYTGGNNWGAAGQEQFWNCADIYISNTCGSPSPVTPAPAVPTVAPVTPAPAVPTVAPVTPAPAVPTVAPVTPAPVVPTVAPTPPPSEFCKGNTNVCFWPLTNQVVPYPKDDCIQQSAFVWCP
ncbi:hypothetical protein SPRG_06922 [Saprolegnia parasitica CBS 223.65]|uniref:Chitin-binding type-4 domain-containing protein n=1 Tax=Saprolegnia parasitica (strain CBS 223.65) TaxID=695850 RepID=A0A067CM99_SAPPC|nr:hypothetical protein SPRG_06922 [Saprolegnia parasitica CBS 223.65]KDO27651.1 hypothetical protein SPRG_06922 [Saprolegnia parasitica CBS 223.65]|eukprot:XP_012201773.1 hypothetical protein SPRG_06922 [Saprolegnia parasitica CBS 223.65]